MTRVLLHGFLGDPSVWDGIAARTDRAIALPGHGGGPVGPTWDANMDAIAAHIDAVAGAGPVTVVGYSLGARVAMGLLAKRRIDRAILISGNPGIVAATRDPIPNDGRAARDAIPSNERATRLASDTAWARRFETEPLGDVIDAWETQPLFSSQKRVAPARLAARRQRRLAHDPQQLARAMIAMSVATMPDYHAVISAQNCVAIVGSDDAKYKRIWTSMPVTTHVIPDCGHDALLEAPDAVRELLENIR